MFTVHDSIWSPQIGFNHKSTHTYGVASTYYFNVKFCLDFWIGEVYFFKYKIILSNNMTVKDITNTFQQIPVDFWDWFRRFYGGYQRVNVKGLMRVEEAKEVQYLLKRFHDRLLAFTSRSRVVSRWKSRYFEFLSQHGPVILFLRMYQGQHVELHNYTQLLLRYCTQC